MRALFPVMLALFACVACAKDMPSVELAGKRFHVEVADTREKQALGLMFRDEMPADQGMLFIFANEAPRQFWMKNTRIPLDILFFDRNLRLINMSANAPPCRASQCRSYSSAAPAMYVLELNAGVASGLGVAPGDELTLQLD